MEPLMSQTEKIFIQISSYRDPELLPTIQDCIRKADNPDNLVFSISWQRSKEDEWDNLDPYLKDERFRIIDIPYEESLGTCWARSEGQKNYKGEKYTLQLDSHHRFVKGWDTKCIKMIEDLKESGVKKPLLTAYLPSYNPSNDPGERVKEVWKLDFDRFTPEGVIFMLPSTHHTWKTEKLPTPTRFFSAHFVFTEGAFIEEVPYDPNLYFHGEEITLAVRSYTHGYDLFIPNQIIAWHEYTRQGRVRHWDENKKWEKLNRDSLIRAKKLLNVDNSNDDTDFDIYGLGKERTKEQYEEYAGIRFHDRSVQQYTLDNHEAPNPKYSSKEYYNKSFVHRFKHCVDIWKGSIPDEDWDGWALVFEDEEGKEIHREDVYREEIQRLKTECKGDFYNIWRSFIFEGMPDHVVVWPFSHTIGWGPKIVYNMPKL
jgi:glycosyltransferase involved in cell wall biosynthesis